MSGLTKEDKSLITFCVDAQIDRFKDVTGNRNMRDHKKDIIKMLKKLKKKIKTLD